MSLSKPVEWKSHATLLIALFACLPILAKSSFEIALENSKTHWAFQPIAQPSIPLASKNLRAIDAFVLSQLRQKNLSPAPPANRKTLIRRLYHDLHGFHRLRRKSIEPETIAIIGSGTIGLCCLLVAKSLGCKNILVLDLIEEKLSRAENFRGQTIQLSKEDYPAKVAEKAESEIGTKPDLVIDAVGIEASFDQAFQMVSEKGNVLLIGNLAKEVQLPLQDLVSRETTLVGTYGFDIKAFIEAVNMLPAINVELQTFIEGHCTIEEVPDVMTALAKGERQALKIVIDFPS